MTRTITLVASCLALLAAVAPAPVHGQSALDGFNPGANFTVSAVALQPDGKIVVGGIFTTLGGGGTGTTSRAFLGRLHADGALDLTFNPGASGPIWALAVQPDGRILVGGGFTRLGGGATTPRSFIARLHADGSLDTTFDPGANGQVSALALQPDGKILVGGGFTMLGGGGTGTTARNGIARLHPDGSLDANFNPGAVGGVNALVLQPDAKILVGGTFELLGGAPRSNIGRLLPGGALDATFDPGANGTVLTMALEPDGQILLGGRFSALGGGGTGSTPRRGIGRVHAAGALDTTFDPGANDVVTAIEVQPDGKTLVGGYFTTLGGGGNGTTARSHIGRLHPDGSIDVAFDPGINNPSALGVPGTFAGTVYDWAVQPDGKILLVGTFSTLGGGGTGTSPRSFIGRLYPDGRVDADFNPGTNGGAYALAVQPDGKILVGGSFTMMGGP